MRRIWKWIVALLLLATMMAGASAFDVPPLRGRINDLDGLLTNEQVASLEAKLRELEEKTTAQVAILTFPNLPKGETTESASLKVAETWKLGQKDKDNGLLIFCVEKGAHCRLEVGYGLEGGIPDGKAGDILRHQIRAKADPKKGTNDFGGGFADAVSVISQIITDEYAKDPTGASLRKHENGGVVTLGIFGLVVLAVAGLIHPFFGGFLGGLFGAGVGLASGLTTVVALAVCVIIGALIGLVVSIVARGMFQGGGYSGWDSGGSSWGSGSGSSDSFSGGGGGFGGGGAGD